MELQIQDSGAAQHSAVQSSRLDYKNSALETLQGTADFGRLVYSPNGLFVVHGEAGHWVVPPTAVLQLDAGVLYGVRKADSVSVRVVEISAPLSLLLPTQSRLYQLTPLLRELLEALSAVPGPIDTDSKAQCLVDLLSRVDVLGDDPTPRCLGVPSDPRVAHICDDVITNLDSPKTLQEWASELKFDTRTLHRLFVQEFGMPFVQWRQQTRLMAALEWLAEGRQIMDVALDLGYQTQSAFSAMFRRNLGITPSEWQEKGRIRASHPRFGAARTR